MRLSYVLCGLALVVCYVNASPIVKRETQENVDPLNEVYVFEMDDDQANADGDRTDRDKRKIGVVKLGVTNGIINFVFGKLDSFLDAKTRALGVLEESNKVKNAAFGIDNTHSATGDFISKFVSQKVAAGAGSIGPIINSATTLLTGTKAGLAGAVVSKLAPLSSIATGLSAGAGAAATGAAHADAGVHAGVNTGANAGVALSGAGANLISGLLTSKINTLSGLSGGISAGGDASHGNGANAGLNLGAFANLGGGEPVSTTTEDIPEFDRNRVSLDVPPPAFGTGFTLVQGISKVLSSVILNSAKRTESVLEVFKPFFRGIFAIKGLPSDNPQ